MLQQKLQVTPGLRQRRLKVNLLLDGSFNIWLHSYFLTGLIQLAEEGVITLAVKRSNNPSHRPVSRRYPILTLQCAEPAVGKTRMICFDPRDQSDAWQMEALAGCDVYYKRSTYAPDTARLTDVQRLKVRSINPMFATWPPAAIRWGMRLCVDFVLNAGQQMLTRRSVQPALQVLRQDFRNLATLSSLDQYEDTPVGAKRKQVLFQTRLWDPAEENGDWVEACNQERVQMIRTLRARLGERCVGGLISMPYTQKHYPDLLSNLTPTAKAKRPEFIRLCRQFLVRVNIKALFDATPYSLGETLAANNCLVSQTIRNSFATPLVDGQHYWGFTTPEECADRCQELLENDNKAQQLREAAYEYYRIAVQPKAAMRMFLEQAMT